MNRVLRCGVQGLPAAEVALIRTLFKLYQHGTSDFCWVLVDTQPCDALLRDANTETPGALPGHEAVEAVLVLGGASLASSPNALARPLRSEMLEAWLLKTQHQIFAKTQPVAAVNALRAHETGAANRVNAACVGLYKLLRWPPATMLRNDPSLIRMATVLSRRPMNINELARVSQQPIDIAHAFVIALYKAALLDSPSRALATPTTNVPRTASSERKVERSLISRIRIRLGL